MKSSFLQELAIGIPINSAACQIHKSSNRYLPGPATQCLQSTKTKTSEQGSRVHSIIKTLGRKSDNHAQDHVRLGPKTTETVKGKLRLGARILQIGGVEKVFKKFFNVEEEERLLKAFQCSLSTTCGPLAGILFISTQKIAFWSDRSIKVSSPEGELIRIHYKVVIPLMKIKCVNESENVDKPRQKYIDITTVDDFEFWFMGFFNHQKAFKYLVKAIHLSSFSLDESTEKKPRGNVQL